MPWYQMPVKNETTDYINSSEVRSISNIKITITKFDQM